jgi:hypothetical protein
MVSRAYILGTVPNRAQSLVITDDQSTGDIEAGIISRHKKFKSDYDQISDQFIADSVEDTAKKIWSFLRKNVPYRRESKNLQTVRSPYAIAAFPADCKSYALFAGGIIDSLNRKGLLNVPWSYRFASYDENNWKEAGHVFVVLYPGTKNEIWIDPVPEISCFDEKLQPVSFKDKFFKPMALVEISGIGSAVPATSRTEKIEVLNEFRGRLDQERRGRLLSGEMLLNSPADLEYVEAIEMVTGEMNKAGIGVVSDIITTVKDVLNIFKKKNETIDDIARRSDQWNKSERELGHQYGWAAADVVKNGRPDIEPEQLLRWLSLNGIQPILNNKEWGTVTKEDIIRYFENRGRPLSDQMKQSLGLSTNLISNLLDPVSGGSSGDGLSKILPILLIGGGVIYFVTRPKRKSRR